MPDGIFHRICFFLFTQIHITHALKSLGHIAGDNMECIVGHLRNQPAVFTLLTLEFHCCFCLGSLHRLQLLGEDGLKQRRHFLLTHIREDHGKCLLQVFAQSSNNHRRHVIIIECDFDGSLIVVLFYAFYLVGHFLVLVLHVVQQEVHFLITGLARFQIIEIFAAGLQAGLHRLVVRLLHGVTELRDDAVRTGRLTAAGGKTQDHGQCQDTCQKTFHLFSLLYFLYRFTAI